MVLIIGTPKKGTPNFEKALFNHTGIPVVEGKLFDCGGVPSCGWLREGPGRTAFRASGGALSGSGLRVQGSGLGIWFGMWCVDCRYRVQFFNKLSSADQETSRNPGLLFEHFNELPVFGKPQKLPHTHTM